MTSSEFDTIFEREAIQRLVPIGFRPRGKNGKTLDLLDGIMLVSWLRLSGRLSLPGSAVWTLCFRHTFLRECNELKVVNGVAGLFTEHYPFKFVPSGLISGRQQLRYHPVLNWDYDRFTYAESSPVTVRKELGVIVEYIIHHFVPWARSVSPEDARAQLCEARSGRWDDGIWIEDYDRYIRAHAKGRSPKRTRN